ncbi:hypothetical protein [Jannaschia pohangensis]|uniref:Uncharacterized protein n=1 Tax=Jannaschia pohangensis TaxID=390807 RepID=A0A1I3HMN9_9RHOB|nr:hypothetical protein [Jannaschia pohangensis]SFI36770.1 hypothetical protein SAMN04488095_0651 [Jannaschia pohangensis]
MSLLTVETRDASGGLTWSVKPGFPTQVCLIALLWVGIGLVMFTGLYRFDVLNWQSALLPTAFLTYGLLGLFLALSSPRDEIFRSRIDRNGIFLCGEASPCVEPSFRFEDIDRAEHRIDAYGEAVFLFTRDAPRAAHILKPPFGPPPKALAEALRARGVSVVGP